MENTELETSLAHQLVGVVNYVPGSIVIKSILRKKTGTVKVLSFDTGETLAAKISPFDNLVQVIDGVAEVIIDEKSTQLEVGQVIIIPAHSTNKMKANERFKMLSTIIKSGYEDVTL
ncbi:MAG: cupin domain-containing protein [Cyclobacteriaceae bacterium]|nr:cupin domain-containing protein [Cyclobacteriaceae bacterium]